MTDIELLQTTFDVADGVAVITLRNAGRRNAWSGRMAGEYRWLLSQCEERTDIRAVVITGADGDFSVGADFGELAKIGDQGDYERPVEIPPAPFPPSADESLRRNHLYPLTLGVPVIAAIEGGCAGAGFVVATYADLRVVSREAKISSAFAGLGLPAEYGIGWILPRMMGTARAATLLLDSGSQRGEDVHRLGWADQLADPGQALDRAREWADRIARTAAPSSVRMIKRQLYVDAWLDAPEAYRRSVEDMNDAVRSADFRRSVKARRQGQRVDFRTQDPTTGETP
jgi:enoyl-CoA hydratase/carnithine racemase